MAHYNINDLVDPQEFKREYPHIRVIDPTYWDNVQAGYYVEIRRQGEHFWVEVVDVTCCEVTGEVYYQLGINPYQIGDTLTFKKCYQFDIYDPQIFNLIPQVHI